MGNKWYKYRWTEVINIHNAPKGTFAGGEPDRGSDTNSYKDSVGRFPANLIHDGSDEVVDLFPNSKGGAFPKTHWSSWFVSPEEKEKRIEMNDSGSASRFFYVAKASKSERNKWLKGFDEKRPDIRTTTGMGTFEEKWVAKQSNHHPTVKPVKLMQYLVRLVTAKWWVCLDPFTWSWTTGIACKLEWVNFVWVDREQEYVDIANARIDAREIEKEEVNSQPSLFW